ncbi:glutamyl-tRNA reductase [Thermodesulfitimonas autotrophica]|uniref:Glutamyl-tRNA reductase n=1 Tax=Thermodesulfitimonas autotrophica TaxID=1894989 RepID=A0A3N5APA6_9THEO|nr:glutamyl-tRNA reductase [Thermodesulfitimonas autotrophica]RPF46694.1 glutamyl-tRNA reductase [Thermodesulfitimonas autotrophica]
MFTIVIGLNHRTAPVEVRERLSFSNEQAREFLTKLRSKPGVSAVVLLSTCNRTEFYMFFTNEIARTAVIEVLCRRAGLEFSELKRYLYVYTENDCVRHLFRVAAGLDSMVLGETQILGQVKDAYQLALEAGTTGGYFNALFQQALAVGKRVRTETGIDKNPVSVSYAAVELAKQNLGSIEGRNVLVVGAGKMSELTVKHLIANGVTGVIVSNRSFERAEELASRFGGRAVRFDELYRWMERADIVISCTGASHYVIHAREMAEVMAKRRGAKIFMIDIAVPRDVEPAVATLPGIVLFDIDALQGVVDGNLAERQRIAAEAERIIEEEVEGFRRRQAEQAVIPTVVALKKLGEEIKQKELRRAFNRLGDLSDYERRVIMSLANSIANQLLHEPVRRLKDLALTSQGLFYAEAVQELFKLDLKENSAQEELPAAAKGKG